MVCIVACDLVLQKSKILLIVTQAFLHPYLGLPLLIAQYVYGACMRIQRAGVYIVLEPLSSALLLCSKKLMKSSADDMIMAKLLIIDTTYINVFRDIDQ